MSNIRKKYTPLFMLKVASMATIGEKTINQISSESAIHSTQINSWKKLLIDSAEYIFGTKRLREEKKRQEEIDKLHRIIGEQNVLIDWLKKKYQQINSP